MTAPTASETIDGNALDILLAEIDKIKDTPAREPEETQEGSSQSSVSEDSLPLTKAVKALVEGRDDQDVEPRLLRMVQGTGTAFIESLDMLLAGTELSEDVQNTIGGLKKIVKQLSEV